jgi:hypothetical protein
LEDLERRRIVGGGSSRLAGVSHRILSLARRQAVIPSYHDQNGPLLGCRTFGN